MIRVKEILDKRGRKTCFLVVGNVKGVPTEVLKHRGFVLTGWLDFSELPPFLKRASVGLALIQPSMFNYIIAQPNKMFVYMVAGLPIVASDLPGMKIIQDEECGILVDPGDVEAIADRIEELLQNESARLLRGGNGRKAAERDYNGEREMDRIMRFYEEITEILY